MLPFAAKYFSQVIDKGTNPVPVEVLATAASKDLASDAISTFAKVYLQNERVGTLVKESHSGKLVDDWKAAISGVSGQPELVDMAPAISTVLAVKDEDELVCANCVRSISLANIAQKVVRTAASLTSTLMAHYVALKLETILDRETKITHEHFAAQIEGRLGTGEKGPDMKVWDKGKGLGSVSRIISC